MDSGQVEMLCEVNDSNLHGGSCSWTENTHLLLDEVHGA